MLRTKSQMKKRLVCRGGLVALALGLISSGGWNTGVSAQTSRAGAMQLNAELATVEVSAKDKKGQPVSGLKRENFGLYINGKRQEIVTFDAVTESGAGPASNDPNSSANPAARGKVVMILFDDHTISLPQLKVTRDAAEKYVQRHMHPQDLVGVAIYGRDLQIVQPFTHDANKVVEAIRKPSATFGQSQMDVGFFGKEGQLLAKNFLRSLTALSNDFGSIKGRKAVLFFTEDFSSIAEAEVTGLIDTARRCKVSFYTLIAKNASASGHLNKSKRATQEARGKITEEKKPASRPSFLSQLAQILQPGTSLMNPSLLAWMTPALPQATRPTGATPTGPTGSNIGDSMGRDVDRIVQGTVGSDIMASLAPATYGDVVRESSDLTKGLDSFDVELSNYYVLGYLPTNIKPEDKLLKVEVKTSVKDIKLLYAKGTFISQQNQNSELSANEKTLFNLLVSNNSSSGIPLEIRPVVFYDSPQLARVTFFGRVNAGAAGVGADKLEFMGGAFDSTGSLTGRFSGSISPLAPSAANAQRPAEIIFQSQFLLKPGKYQVKMAVVNAAGKTGSQAAPLEVPALAENSLGTSSLVVSSRLTPLPDLVKNVQVQLLNESNPMAFKGYEIAPSMDNRIDRKLPLAVFYKVYNLKSAGPDWALMAKPSLIDEKGQTHTLPAIKLTRVVQPSGPGQVTLGYNFPVRDLEPGKYRLLIETVDSTSDQSATCQTEVTLQ